MLIDWKLEACFCLPLIVLKDSHLSLLAAKTGLHKTLAFHSYWHNFAVRSNASESYRVKPEVDMTKVIIWLRLLLFFFFFFLNYKIFKFCLTV